MRQIEGYIILDDFIEPMGDNVIQLSKDGWELYGSPGTSKSGSTVIHSQAMVKYKEVADAYI